jgi:hypothetical protein
VPWGCGFVQGKKWCGRFEGWVSWRGKCFGWALEPRSGSWAPLKKGLEGNVFFERHETLNKPSMESALCPAKRWERRQVVWQVSDLHGDIVSPIDFGPTLPQNEGSKAKS